MFQYGVLQRYSSTYMRVKYPFRFPREAAGYGFYAAMGYRVEKTPAVYTRFTTKRVTAVCLKIIAVSIWRRLILLPELIIVAAAYLDIFIGAR